jgi:hypothetical protein
MTQDLGGDPMHVMLRRIMALFDEYQSRPTPNHAIPQTRNTKVTPPRVAGGPAMLAAMTCAIEGGRVVTVRSLTWS